MATATQKVKPRLNSLDDLLKLNAETHNPTGVIQPFPEKTDETAQKQPPANTEYAMVPFELMDDYPGHPFRRYTGQRKADMLDSIREYGILQPLMLRPAENGRYHIMAGHNRKDNGQEAGLLEGPCVIKHNLTDDEAWVYVIETNLIQRSFGDMLPSEQAAVIALRHSKMVSQGKRSDILAEIKQLENPHDSGENGTSVANPQKLYTREALAQEYGLAPYNIAKYLRVNKLIDALKKRLDSREIPLYPAATLSFLTAKEQREVDKCMELNGFKMDGKKADVLREHSEGKKLDDEKIYYILSGELTQAPKKSRNPTVKMTKAVYSKYFTSEQSAKEVQEYVEKALEFYHSHMQSRETKTAPSHSVEEYSAPDEDAGLDHDDEMGMEP